MGSDGRKEEAKFLACSEKALYRYLLHGDCLGRGILRPALSFLLDMATLRPIGAVNAAMKRAPEGNPEGQEVA